MQLVKIGLLLLLLSIILFFIIKDHNKDKEKFNNDVGNGIFSSGNGNSNGSSSGKAGSGGMCGSSIGGGGTCGSSGDGSGDSSGNSDSSGDSSGGCSSCSMPGASTQLLPVMDPLFNMREICKQSILLEDHLFQKKKRCRDCCIKHQLTIEALAEEAITLDKDRKCEDLYYLPDRIRELQKDFVNGREPGEIAHEYRKLRKSLMQRCFTNF